MLPKEEPVRRRYSQVKGNFESGTEDSCLFAVDDEAAFMADTCG